MNGGACSLLNPHFLNLPFLDTCKASSAFLCHEKARWLILLCTQDRGLKYGFVITIQELANTVPTLWTTTQRFLAANQARLCRGATLLRAHAPCTQQHMVRRPAKAILRNVQPFSSSCRTLCRGPT